jgi:hypothetical protein
VKVVYVDHLNQRTTFTDPRLAFAAEKKSQETPFRKKNISVVIMLCNSGTV